MLSKAKRPYTPSDLPPDKRLRANVTDLFVTNVVSGLRTQEVLNDIAGVAGSFAKDKRPLGTNAARNLRRSVLKRTLWPSLYWARIRVWNCKKGIEDYKSCAFLLPHELLHTLNRLGLSEVLLCKEGLDRSGRST